MGQCGCADNQDVVRFPGPSGIVYTIDIYSGCKCCDTPAGVILRRYSDDEMWKCFIDDLPEAPFGSYGPDRNDPDPSGDLFVHVVDPRALAAAVAKALDGCFITRDGETYPADEFLAEEFADELDAVVRDAVVQGDKRLRERAQAFAAKGGAGRNQGGDRGK